MKKAILFILLLQFTVLAAQDKFPDGTAVPDWFRKTDAVNLTSLGKQYKVTDYGVGSDSTLLQTQKLQAVIDKAAQDGGVVVLPKGTYLTGALFFKPRTHLYLEEGAVLKGSDDISDFPVVMTRIEGETCKYFPALINADSVDGFTISGKGTIDGNGLRYWKAFWLRREWNPKCTNKDEMRPRLIYVSNSKNIQVSGLKLKNSPFWTTHFYKCEYVKLFNLTITSPKAPVKAPSTDAVDLDVCSNVLIKNCYMSVNDDAVALKGGKGPQSDKDPNNGENRNIIIEDNTYGFCHSALTCGSESIHNYNIIFRRCTLHEAQKTLHLKMRPDTPQRYEYITVEDITGDAGSLVSIKPWTQFFDLKGEKDIKLSYASTIVMKNIKLQCSTGFDIEKSEQYILSDFTFQDIELKSAKGAIENTAAIKDAVLKNVNVKP
ncbi:exopolygalacturonase [Flavobacterium akiainvivens]|uniref:Exopolygalacturonase n=1 Tax=Flavobacterium akiainvivens TaxID=1202724 RepID=A0A0M8M8D3_9FLAO|nr:glycosyl hydrolase family 28 protein [Flavobacterium akiainvivens]KOS05643.1 exopolygalacturonase [Flavobacterium akiainvivens]SFQ35916.1 Polygalacturonase [Flavobacterium akiainvivens]